MDPRALEFLNLLFLLGLFTGFGLFLSLAYLGEREVAVKWLVLVVLLLGLGGLALTGLALAAFPLLVPMLARALAADDALSGMTQEALRQANIDAQDLLAPMATSLGWAGWLVLLIAVLAFVALLLPVRRLLARVLPIEPDRLVHTVALQYAAYLMVLSVLTLASVNILLGAEPSEELIESLGAGATLASLWVQALGFVIIAALGVGLLVRRDGRETAGRLGLTRAFSLRWFLLVVLVGLVTGFGTDQAWKLVAPESQAAVERLTEMMLGPIIQTGLVGALTIGLSAGIGEELLFRGAAQPKLGLVFTSLLFAAIHTQYAISPALIQVFVLGLLLGLTRQRANTTTAIAAHAAYNFTLAMLALYAPELGP